ncbi:MAG: diaminopimelate decarboxylase, partial [Vibrio sp.]
MDYFNYQDDGQLWAEQVPLADLATQYGTPLYVYSRATLERHWRAFDQALGDFPHLICYAVKANSNLGVLNVLARLGSGFDIVSIGELERVLAAGGDPSKVVFSGVGKTDAEMRRALQLQIKCFNVESEPELLRLNQVAAELGVCAPISLRINPDVDAKTHPYISTGLRDNKFGIT